MDVAALAEIPLLALLLWGEARGETTVGMLAVAHVVLNRVARDGWYGESVKEVILKPWQFSCFNPDSLVRRLLEERGKSSEAFPDIARCMLVAELALAGFTVDPTGGATHYHAQRVTPDWADGMTKTVRIGEHIFLRED